MKDYKDLVAWKKAVELVKEIYAVSKNYPESERFGLIQQTRRAAVSVSSNIAEGIGRNYKKETIQFLHIARGSLYELESLLIVAHAVGCIRQELQLKLAEAINECLKILNGLITYYERSNLK